MSVIVAISTAPGNSGIGIVRMSGKECFEILDKIFMPKTKNKTGEIKGYTIKYGYVHDLNNKEIIDEVLVSYFKEPKSYTTENMCEINCHGGTVVLKKILEQCIKAGARMAEAGEFTKLAFLNGRIDLSQAESIIDLINSKTEKEAKASIKGLEGELSIKINQVREKILDLMADIEVNIDYPEYDVPEISYSKEKTVLENIKGELEKLEKSFETGRILKEGIKTAIIGRPNVGKSSLLNLMLKEERAIVSDIEGTTRDTIEEMIQIEGIPLKIIDTAGIRDTADEIESIGVDKAKKIANEADLIIAIFDASKEISKEDKYILEIIKNKKSIIVLNKIDLGKKIKLPIKINNIVEISIKTKQGIDELYKNIIELFNIGEIESDQSIIITNIRHKNKITNSIEALKKAISGIEEKLPVDIISINIIQCLNELGEITGDNVSEDIINKIFSKFCLGK